MPYRTTPFSTGSYYHLYNRGNNREPIFFERANYLYFLNEIRQYLCPCEDVVAYVLMPNHYHLLVRLKGDEVSEAMRTLTISYTKAINKRHERVGTLFQGRYRSVLIDKEQYWVHLTRYIHLNPVKAHLCANAEEWEFSSYREYVGLRKGTLPCTGEILSLFVSPNAYRHFVEDARVNEVIIDHLVLDG